MLTDTLRLALAGNLPFYDVSDYQNPSSWKRLKRAVIDYRTTAYNNPVGQGGHYLMEGVRELKDRGFTMADFELWGSIDERYRSLVVGYGIEEYVSISGFVPKAKSLERLSRADVLILTLAEGTPPWEPFALPGKMFDYFRIGKPILALVEESECSEILLGSGLALIVDPKDPKAFADAVQHLQSDAAYLESFKRNDGFLKQFQKEQMVEHMASLFDHLLDN